MTRDTLTFIFMVLLFSSTLHAQPAQEDSLPEAQRIVVGYSTTFFYQEDALDALAALEVMIDKIFRNQFRVEIETHLIDGLPAVVEGVNAGKVDMVGLLALEYLQIKDKAQLDPIMVGAQGETFSDKFSILVSQRGGVRDLADLVGQKLVVSTGNRGHLMPLWLDTLLLKKGLSEREAFFSEIQQVKKASDAILQVLFGEAGACIVNNRAFEIMAELNPQVRGDIKVLVTSQGFCRGIACVRRDFNSRIRNLLEEELLVFHTEPQGDQVLRFFRIDRLVPFKTEYLDSVIALVEEYNALKAGRDP